MAAHARKAYKECIDCGAPGTPGHGLSFRGLCVECSITRQAEANRQMALKEGPAFEQWQRSMIDHARDYLRQHAASA